LPASIFQKENIILKPCLWEHVLSEVHTLKNKAPVKTKNYSKKDAAPCTPCHLGEDGRE